MATQRFRQLTPARLDSIRRPAPCCIGYPPTRLAWPLISPPSDVTALPLLPLRDVVVFPHMVIPLFVGRPKSIKALDVAMDAGKHILLVAQKQAAKDDPGAEDLYEIGSVATVLQMLKLPDGTVKVLVEGTQRARDRAASTDRGEYLSAQARSRSPGDPGAARTRSRRCAARCSRSSTSTSSSTRRSRRRS